MWTEKRAIRAAFGRAANTYDAVANVQRRIADNLLSMCAPSAEDVVLDAGSGTGYGTRKLMAAEKSVHCFSLDSALEMAAQISTNSLCGDIEALPLASGCIDLYWSSLAWQWVDAQRAIAEASRVIRSGGKLHVATLGPQTLSELRNAFAVTDDATHVRRFTPVQNYRDWLQHAGFIDCGITQETITVHAADLRTLLHELKTLGAHVIGENRRRGLFGRRAWQRVEARYELLRTPHGLPASYDVIYLSATRKS